MSNFNMKQKLAIHYYFIVLNSVFVIAIGAIYWFTRAPGNYFPIPVANNYFAITYLVSMHIIILTLLVAIARLIILPTIYLPQKAFFIIQLIFTFILTTIFLFDITTFHTDAVHLLDINIPYTIEHVLSMNAIFEKNRIIDYCVWLLLLTLIYKLSNLIISKTWLNKHNIGSKYAIFVLSLMAISQLIYFSGSKQRQQQLLSYIQRFQMFSYDNSKVASAVKNTYKLVNFNKVQYPAKLLVTTKVNNPPNILIIAMDAWRFDCFNATDSPNLWKFAQNGKVFSNHFAAANRTRPSLFGLLYGIPSTYMATFFRKKQTPVLIKQLQQMNYQINFFNGFGKKENEQYTKKIFTNIDDLYIESQDTSNAMHDSKLTNDMLAWHANRNKNKPWFAFVFYDALHGPNFPEGYSTIAVQSGDISSYKKFAKYVGKDVFIASYKTSVHYLDSLAAKILNKLQKSNDLANTIVIITADHGNEFNDNQQGEWGYGSNFTNCQIKVPFAIILPEDHKNKLTLATDSLTSHYDIVPTLMKNFLGVNNPIADYSVGNDLLNNDIAKDWMLVGTIGGYSLSAAIVFKDYALKIMPSQCNLIDNFNRLIFSQDINTTYIKQALEYMSRFMIK